MEALLDRLDGEILRPRAPAVEGGRLLDARDALDHCLELGEVELPDDVRPELLEVPQPNLAEVLRDRLGRDRPPRDGRQIASQMAKSIISCSASSFAARGDSRVSDVKGSVPLPKRQYLTNHSALPLSMNAGRPPAPVR